MLKIFIFKFYFFIKIGFFCKLLLIIKQIYKISSNCTEMICSLIHFILPKPNFALEFVGYQKKISSRFSRNIAFFCNECGVILPHKTGENIQKGNCPNPQCNSSLNLSSAKALKLFDIQLPLQKIAFNHPNVFDRDYLLSFRGKPLGDIRTSPNFQNILANNPCDTHVAILTLASDGIPFAKNTSHSIEPYSAIVLNLDPGLSTNMSALVPLMIIPGPQQPSNRQYILDFFLKSIKQKNQEGGFPVLLRSGKQIKIKVRFITLVGDLVGMSKILPFSHQRLQGCYFCDVKGERVLGRTVYPTLSNGCNRTTISVQQNHANRLYLETHTGIDDIDTAGVEIDEECALFRHSDVRVESLTLDLMHFIENLWQVFIRLLKGERIIKIPLSPEQKSFVNKERAERLEVKKRRRSFLHSHDGPSNSFKRKSSSSSSKNSKKKKNISYKSDSEIESSSKPKFDIESFNDESDEEDEFETAEFKREIRIYKKNELIFKKWKLYDFEPTDCDKLFQRKLFRSDCNCIHLFY